MPVSLLTPLAHDLGITEGTAGQGMTISGVFAVFTSLSIRRLAGTLNRKFLLLGLTALMGLSAVLVALAPNYLIYMLGRAMIGVVIGGFWSMSVTTAVRLVHISKVRVPWPYSMEEMPWRVTGCQMKCSVDSAQSVVCINQTFISHRRDSQKGASIVYALEWRVPIASINRGAS